MSFIEKHQKIVSKVSHINNFKLWIHSLIFGAIIFALTYGYYQLTGEGATGRRLIGEVTANAGMIMIGISFALSGLTYFWNFVDTKIIYRKHLGLVGFYMIIVHVILTLYFMITNTTRAFTDWQDVIAFFIGCASLFIFVVMALISNRYSVLELGPKAWRIMLRTGYVAYFFAVVHLIIKKYPTWQEWLNGELPLPPISLVITVLALIVFLLRIALWISLERKKKPEQNKETLLVENEKTTNDNAV